MAKEDAVNLGGKQDLDALLRKWPATPPKSVVAAGSDEERGWDERADAIVRAAGKAARDGAAKDAAEALFAAPALAPEAGEDTVVAAGEQKMSDEKESVRPPASTTTPVPSQKRQSLKEIAARASQAGAARLSQPGAPPASTPPPRASTPAPPPVSTPLPRPVEASKDDSGVINLNVVQATATAQQRADAEKAKPAQASLFDEEKPAANAAAAPAKATNVTPLQPKKSNAGAIGGIAIAVLGIAAAFAITARKPPPAPAPVAAVAQENKATAAATPPPSAAPAPATAAPTAVASAEPAPTAGPENKAVEAPKGPAVAVGSGAATAGAASTADAKLAAKAPTPSGKPGDLQSEMAKAVGKDGAAQPDQPSGPAPEPAAGGPKNQNIPEQPSQGAVAAAFGPVMGGAKACVAGADDVSRASVTFSSAGTVTSVSVSGWAAANGKSACIQAALKAAKVGPFSKPSFTVGVPIRP
jgi:hypothetical protein